jgi:hypothetical protein
MPAPTVHPDQRDPAFVAPTDTYLPRDRVWVFRHGCWRPGLVEVCSAMAATVTYQTAGTRGTGVDTVTASFVLPRADLEPMIDGGARRRSPSYLEATPP